MTAVHSMPGSTKEVSVVAGLSHMSDCLYVLQEPSDVEGLLKSGSVEKMAWGEPDEADVHDILIEFEVSVRER
jgi:hypothetical protein